MLIQRRIALPASFYSLRDALAAFGAPAHPNSTRIGTRIEFARLSCGANFS
jgi:hypothetical protein